MSRVRRRTLATDTPAKGSYVYYFPPVCFCAWQPAVRIQSNPPETESIDTTENQDGDHSHEIRLLTPEKTLHTYYEWEDETTFVKGKVCIFTFS